jgi:glycosyltransferase involved in cell wall biosynthesis
MPRYGFFTERQVGIGSAAAAIEPYLKASGCVEWTDVTYAGGILERLPLPKRVSGTLRGIEQVTRALIRRPSFDALFFLTQNPAVFQQWALARTPTLLWTDVTPALLDAQAEQYDHAVDDSRAVARLKHAVVKRTFRLAARAVGWSDWARRSLVADYGVPEERTLVVPPGVDLRAFSAPAERREPGLPRLLFVGGNFGRKGGDSLLDVFQRALRGRCELDLVTRDPVPEQEGVRVHRGLTPASPELRRLYERAAAFVLPTRGDCFSIASLEAMAMALPVVVSDVGGISEIVDPETGFLIPVGDARALHDALQALLESPERRTAMGHAGRCKVEAKFSAASTAQRLLELMAEITAEKRAHLGGGGGGGGGGGILNVSHAGV